VAGLNGKRRKAYKFGALSIALADIWVGKVVNVAWGADSRAIHIVGVDVVALLIGLERGPGVGGGFHGHGECLGTLAIGRLEYKSLRRHTPEWAVEGSYMYSGRM
jgi:hypothetical protein